MSFALYRTQDQSPMNLQLGDVVKDQVRGTFKRLLKCHDGQRVLIKVPNFYSDTPLQIHVNQHTTARDIYSKGMRKLCVFQILYYLSRREFSIREFLSEFGLPYYFKHGI